MKVYDYSKVERIRLPENFAEISYILNIHKNAFLMTKAFKELILIDNEFFMIYRIQHVSGWTIDFELTKCPTFNDNIVWMDAEHKGEIKSYWYHRNLKNKYKDFYQIFYTL